MENKEKTASFELLNSASFGGPNWRPRVRSHVEELKDEKIWNSCGVNQEWAPLKKVLLAWPQDTLETEDLDAALLIRKVNLNRLRNQTEKLASFYEDKGIQAYLYRPAKVAPPNLIFMRDTFFMTPGGAVLGRLGGQARAGEERFVADALASYGIPIIRSMLGVGCFEGADALWMNDQKVLISGGFRTNQDGIRQVSGLLTELGVKVESIDLPRGTQHLLGAVNFVNRNRAVVRAELLTSQIRQVLEKNEISFLPISSSEEVIEKRSMNFVTLKPNCIVMPSGCPMTRKIYEAWGIECFEADVSEYMNAGGALGCLTGIIQRSFE